jgi:hypothetical protein
MQAMNPDGIDLSPRLDPLYWLRELRRRNRDPASARGIK